MHSYLKVTHRKDGCIGRLIGCLTALVLLDMRFWQWYYIRFKSSGCKTVSLAEQFPTS